MNVTVFGAGYVGLVTGAVLADLGHQVNLIDIDTDKVEKINRGQPPIYEFELQSLLQRVISSHRLKARTEPTAHVSDSEVIFIAVGTPSLDDGAPNLDFVHQAATTIGQHLNPKRSYVIVNKATVPIGSANLVEMWIDDGFVQANGRPTPQGMYTVASNPEFLREGRAIHDTLYPDRIVLGADHPEALNLLANLYRPILDQSFEPPPRLLRPQGVKSVPLVRTDRLSAEMIKYAANAFLSTKISFANEMANICERVGADIHTVMSGIGLDNRIGPQFLNAGVGWGGSCFGKDLSALIYTAWEYGYEPKLLESTRQINDQQRKSMIKRLQDELKTLKGRRIAVWGLAFKPGTDDLRDAPALSIIAELLHLNARVMVYDPVAMDNMRRQYSDWDIRYAKEPMDALDGADALVVLTEWEIFRQVSLEDILNRLKTPIIIDGRNVFDPNEARRLLVRYRGIGR